MKNVLFLIISILSSSAIAGKYLETTYNGLLVKLTQANTVKDSLNDYFNGSAKLYFDVEIKGNGESCKASKVEFDNKKLDLVVLDVPSGNPLYLYGNLNVPSTGKSCQLILYAWRPRQFATNCDCDFGQLKGTGADIKKLNWVPIEVKNK